MKNGQVYLLHLSRPMGHSKHYLGFTTSLEKRLQRHRSGRGAKMLAAAKSAGIGFQLVRVWNNVSPAFERRLKNAKNGPRFCPVCNPEYAITNATSGAPVLVEVMDDA